METELLLDAAVASHLIDVSVNEGVVTLSGLVDNLFMQERAVSLTQKVKGVRSVINQIEVRAAERPDNEIKQNIESALLFDPATDSYEINVRANNGIVTLTGTVSSWAEKQLAGNVVKGVRGVRRVINNISIDFAEERLDSEIKAEIEKRIESDPYLEAALVNTRVDNGQVTLTGTVGSAAERLIAYNKSWVNGVQAVDNAGLEVEPWAREVNLKATPFQARPDEAVRESVTDAFVYDPRVNSFNIETDVTNGLVTLTGEVDNLKAKKATAADARNTSGVWRVINRIKVRPDELPDDLALGQDVREALKWDPVVDRFDISVVVRNAKVYLGGEVDSYYEREHAADVVSRVNGVVDIENNLAVQPETVAADDPAIEQNIDRELFWSTLVDSGDVDAEVDNGTATLTGEVDTLQEMRAAVSNAFQGGARSVASRIDVAEAPEYYPVYDTLEYEYWFVK